MEMVVRVYDVHNIRNVKSYRLPLTPTLDTDGEQMDFVNILDRDFKGEWCIESVKNNPMPSLLYDRSLESWEIAENIESMADQVAQIKTKKELDAFAHWIEKNREFYGIYSFYEHFSKEYKVAKKTVSGAELYDMVATLELKVTDMPISKERSALHEQIGTFRKAIAELLEK